MCIFGIWSIFGSYVENVFLPTDKHRLQPNDSDELFIVIGPAHPEWRNIGRVLGFKHNELSAIVPHGGLTSQRDYFEGKLFVWLKWAPTDVANATTEAVRNEPDFVGMERAFEASVFLLWILLICIVCLVFWV